MDPSSDTMYCKMHFLQLIKTTGVHSPTRALGDGSPLPRAPPPFSGRNQRAEAQMQAQAQAEVEAEAEVEAAEVAAEARAAAVEVAVASLADTAASLLDQRPAGILTPEAISRLLSPRSSSGVSPPQRASAAATPPSPPSASASSLGPGSPTDSPSRLARGRQQSFERSGARRQSASSRSPLAKSPSANESPSAERGLASDVAKEAGGSISTARSAARYREVPPPAAVTSSPAAAWLAAAEEEEDAEMVSAEMSSQRRELFSDRSARDEMLSAAEMRHSTAPSHAPAPLPPPPGRPRRQTSILGRFALGRKASPRALS